MKLPGCYWYLVNDTPCFQSPSRYFPNTGAAQAGVALITVLLIVFLASVAATSLAALQQIAIRRSTVLQHQQQARLYTLGAEEWAMLALARDRKKNETDHLGEAWAHPPAVLPLKEGALSIQMRDLQGCFNLNNLWKPAASPGATANPGTAAQTGALQKNQKQPAKATQAGEVAGQAGQQSSSDNAANTADSADSEATQSGKGELNEAQFQVLQRLLVSLELKPELAQAIVDWIDPDQDPLFPEGAEDSDYNVRTPPYLAANRSLQSVGELRLLKGIEQEAYDKLSPLVCVLPPNTPLNVNTAPAAVLAALAEEKDIKEIERLLENPPDEGYKNVDDFLNAAKLTVDATIKAQLGVASRYFGLRVEARVGDGRAMLYSILQRDTKRVRVLRRSFGNQD